MSMKEISLTGGAANAHQEFQAVLNGREITFRLFWCSYVDAPFWNLDLYENGELLVAGLVLKPGSDLLSAYHFDLGKLVMVGEEPTLDNLGERNNLVAVD